MEVSAGQEYFWLAERVMEGYRIPESERPDVLAESVFLAFIAPYPLSFTLIRWATLIAIRKYCGINPKYTLIPFSQLGDTWLTYQPEVQEDNVVNLEKFRTQKKTSPLSV